MCRRWQLMELEKNLLGQFVFTETLLWSNFEKTDELRIGQDMGFLYRIDIFIWDCSNAYITFYLDIGF